LSHGIFVRVSVGMRVIGVLAMRILRLGSVVGAKSDFLTFNTYHEHHERYEHKKAAHLQCEGQFLRGPRDAFWPTFGAGTHCSGFIMLFFEFASLTAYVCCKKHI
jgi:hypothetical protein